MRPSAVRRVATPEWRSVKPKSVPIMTRLDPTSIAVLDLLVESAIAKSRSDALAYCVRHFADVDAPFLAALDAALKNVRAARERGPK